MTPGLLFVPGPVGDPRWREVSDNYPALPVEELGEAAVRMQVIFDGEGGWSLLLSEYAQAARQP